MSEPIFFESPEAFYAWLEEHHETETEVSVGYWKKGTGRPSLTWSEAVDQALCFGWIDSRANTIDEERYRQRFTPRKPGSNWSKVNIAKVAVLDGGRQDAAGRAGRLRGAHGGKSGVYSFEREKPAELPRGYEKQLRADAAAWEYWQARPPSYRRTATHWVVSAKREETRERRLAQLIESSAAGEHVPPLRR